ncbi:MAG: succinate dehydrogenase, cytochrome b556 subunit [Candidatus Aquirickettsiella sp.]
MSKRPINLNLLTIRFPITAIASILHRISGFFLFLVIPIFLAVVALTLQSPEAFFTVHTCFAHPLIKLILLGFLWALFYHLFAGIRHLLMDAGMGEELKSARFSASLVMILAIVGTGVMGIYIW